MSGFRYRPEVDGLRTFAILPVVLYHLEPKLLPGGYSGVDVFFVISGYLITSIILKEHAEGRFTFSSFWIRRARRILPALLTVLAACAVGAPWLMAGFEVNDLGRHGLAALFSSANFTLWWAEGSYWGRHAEAEPLLHLWSLAVEEQFYLLYPLALVALLRHGRRSAVFTMGAVVVASLGLSLLEARLAPDRAFYLMPSRAWELGVGCLVAMGEREGWFSRLATTWAGATVAGAGLVAVVASSLLLDGKEGPPGQLLLPVLGCAAVIACGVCPTSPANRLLSLGPVVYCGRISYSLYLWHWPLMVAWRLANERYLAALPLWSCLPVAAVAAVASYHLVEQPARKAGSALRWIALTFVAMALVASWQCFGNQVRDMSMFAPLRSSMRGYDANPQVAATPGPLIQQRGGGLQVLEPDFRPAPEAYRSGGFVRRHGTDTPAIVVLGDSHALMWAPAIDAVADELDQTVAFYTAGGVPPHVPLPPRLPSARNSEMTDEQALEWERQKLDHIARWRPRVVIIACNWAWTPSGGVLDRYLREVRRHASTVILLEQPPVLHFGDMNAGQFARLRRLGPAAPGVGLALPTRGVRDRREQGRFDDGRRLVRFMSATIDGVELLPTHDLFASGSDSANLMVGNVLLYVDDDHLSDDGAALLVPRLRERLVSLLGPAPTDSLPDTPPADQRASPTSGVDR